MDYEQNGRQEQERTETSAAPGLSAALERVMSASGRRTTKIDAAYQLIDAATPGGIRDAATAATAAQLIAAAETAGARRETATGEAGAVTLAILTARQQLIAFSKVYRMQTGQTNATTDPVPIHWRQ